MKAIIQLIIALFTLFAFSGCDAFLDEKPNQKLVVPGTLDDLQGLMDNPAALGLTHTYLPDLVSDDYYNTLADQQALEEDGLKKAYVWERELTTVNSTAWNSCYDAIYYCNSVLKGLEAIPVTEIKASRYHDIRGQAHYYRAKFYLLAAGIWCDAYDEGSAMNTPGLPLRVDVDFNKKSVRSTVEETYSLIVSDLQQASAVLPINKAHPLRPSKAAAYGLLARTFLMMGKYPDAGAYADSCLRLNSGLLDYNSLNTLDNFPIKYTNPEVIILNRIGIPVPLSAPNGKVDTVLYASYAGNDLRKSIFFKKNPDNSYSFRGGYEGNGSFFGGLATDEIYLIRAECYAREGKITAALADLNSLLAKRWKAGTFVPFTTSGIEETLALILSERRKELLFRTLRWMDIKRLNKEGRAVSLKRKLGNVEYNLPANDKRFVLPFPSEVIAITGMEQNPE